MLAILTLIIAKIKELIKKKKRVSSKLSNIHDV